MEYEKKESLYRRIFKSTYFKLGMIFYAVFFIISTVFFSSKIYEKIKSEINTYTPINKVISLKLIRFLSFFDLLSISSIPKETVAVIKLSGVIHSDSGSQGINSINVSNAINQLNTLYNLKAIVLSLDSPGGSGVESDIISNALRSAASKHNVPIYSFIKEYGASGGYWIACAGEKIFANQNSVVGSIGVISVGFGFQNLIQSWGIERRVYSSGKNKSFLDPFLSVKEEDVAKISEMQQSIHANFIKYVKDRRGDRLQADDDLLFNGDIWNGNAALDLGLIDGITNIEEFLKKEFPESSVKYLTGIQHYYSAASLLDRMFVSFFNKLEIHILKSQSLKFLFF